MRILVLDDMKVRHEAFVRFYEGHDVVSTFTYRQFLICLNTQEWDLIHLDHDLGDDRDADWYVDGWGKKREYNGMHAAMRICELDESKRPKQVIVHSVNNVGAPGMVQMLRKAGVDTKWEPFGEVSMEEDK